MEQISPDSPSTRMSAVLLARRVSSVASALAGVLAAVVIVGYLARSRLAVQLLPGLPPMYPVTAASLLLLAVAVLTASSTSTATRTFGAVASLVVALAGACGLYLNLTEAGASPYDVWVEGFVTATTLVPGRPVAESCLSLVLLAGATFALNNRRLPRASQALSMAAVTVGLSAVIGYALDASDTGFRKNAVLVGMALNTGICITLLAVATMLARPDTGLLGQLFDGGIAGARTRRLTALTAVGPVVVLLFGVAIYSVAPTDDFARAVYSVLQVGTLGALVLIPAGTASGVEGELRRRLQAIRRGEESEAEVDVVIRELLADSGEGFVLPDWEIGYRIEPSRGHLTGDFAVVCAAPDGQRMLVAIVDVAGHGAEPAVLAYGLRTLIRGLWEHGATLAEVVEAANAKAIRRRTIATGVFVELRRGSDLVALVNAGHPAPVHLSNGPHRWEGTGPLLGLPGVDRAVRTAEVSPGDLVVLFSDGLQEARSGSGDFMGDGLLVKVTEMAREAPVQSVADNIVDTALDFRRDRLVDDVLVLALRRVR